MWSFTVFKAICNFFFQFCNFWRLPFAEHVYQTWTRNTQNGQIEKKKKKLQTSGCNEPKIRKENKTKYFDKT